MTDSEKLIPEWMRKKRDEQDRQEAQEQARLQKEFAAMRQIEFEAPVFWNRLVAQLKIATDALHFLKLDGSFSSIGDDQLRIQVGKPGLFANFTYTDLFFDAPTRIRGNTLDAGTYTLEFCLDAYSKLGVVPRDGRQVVAFMNEEGASEFIMSRMTNLVEKRNR